MLVLAGLELIFFIVASMVLCFGFVLGTVLVTQVNVFITAEQRLHRAKAFSAHHTTLPVRETGGVQEVGRGHSQDS